MPKLTAIYNDHSSDSLRLVQHLVCPVAIQSCNSFQVTDHGGMTCPKPEELLGNRLGPKRKLSFRADLMHACSLFQNFAIDTPLFIGNPSYTAKCSWTHYGTTLRLSMNVFRCTITLRAATS